MSTQEICGCCGKSLSPEQAVYLDGEDGAYCLYCALSETLEDDGSRRLSLSLDYLRRLVEGIL